MASIHKRQQGDRVSWRVHHRTDGVQRNRTFAKRSDAERFVAELESRSHASSADRSRAAAAVTVGEWADIWLAGQAHLKPSTLERYAGVVRTHVVPAWGTVRLDQVTHAGVQAWVATLATERSPATVRKAHRVLSLMLDLAVRDGRLPRNVAKGINLPRPVRQEQRFLTIAQVEALANECGHPTRTASTARWPTGTTSPTGWPCCSWPTPASGSVRWLRCGLGGSTWRGAALSSRVGHRGVSGHGMVWGAPKTHQTQRGADPAVPGRRAGRPRRGQGAGATWCSPASAAVGPIRGRRSSAAVTSTPQRRRSGFPGLHPHELRHTAASLAIANGADVKVVQQMLGHASATMTLDIYGHLFGNRLDEVADALDRARNRAALGE